MRHRLPTRAGPAALAALALSACAGQAPAPGPARLEPAVQRGHNFAQQRCSGCHAIGLDDGGATEGPPFRVLAQRYNALSLQRRFAEVSAHGYDRMPPVTFTPAQADDLVAYMTSLTAR